MAVADNIKEALCKDAHVGRLHITVVEIENAIVLRGRVSTYYLKQLASERTLKVLRNKKVSFVLRNEIVVTGKITLQPTDS